MEGAEMLKSIGGPAGCRALSEAFYSRVKADPVLRPFFPGVSLRCAVEELSAFLVQLLEGPPDETQKRWWVSLRESHQRFRIGPRERDAWLGRMQDTLADLHLQSPARDALWQVFENLSAHIVNTDSSGAGTPACAPTSVGASERSSDHGRAFGGYPDLADRQREVDAIVAEVRAGNIDRSIELSEASDYIQGNPAVLAGLLGLMLTDGHFADHVRAKIDREPALAVTRYSGRTLLHTAAAAGDTGTLELLLRLGAPADVLDDGSHTPLYSVANQCQAAGGPEVVRTLVRAGANVNACEGSKSCTPLHMAARRGHDEIAAALLDCGAQLDPRDSVGETPLRRAVNCNKPAIAALLALRGADLNSVGSKGLTPKSAARTTAMRRALETGV
ncbi:MAG: ankyrin repeat domain-containing protein [Candidatus Solibacter sp.]